MSELLNLLVSGLRILGLDGGGGSYFRKSRSIESWNLYLGIDINIDVEIKTFLSGLFLGVVSSCIPGS